MFQKISTYISHIKIKISKSPKAKLAFIMPALVYYSIRASYKLNSDEWRLIITFSMIYI